MKQMIGILFAGAIALSAQGFTTNVSTVAELAGALQYMNTAANAVHTTNRGVIFFIHFP